MKILNTRKFVGSGMIVIFAMLSACASGPTANSSASKRKTMDLQTRTYLGNCVVEVEEEGREGALTALAEVVIPQIISTGLGRIGTALRNAGEEQIHTRQAHWNFNLDDDSSRKCVQIVHGAIATNAAGMAKNSLRIADVDAEVTKGKLVENHIYLAARPLFFLEARLIESHNKSALRLAMTHLEYNGNLKKGKYSGKSRALNIELSFSPPLGGSTNKKGVGTSLVLGDFVPGFHRTYLDFEAELKTWVPSLETPWFNHYLGVAGGASGVGKPLTMTANIFETKSANTVLLALADIFDNSKATLQTELEKLTISSKRREAEVKEMEDRKKLLDAFYSSLLSSQSAIADYCDNSPTGISNEDKRARFGKAQLAELAQRQANIDAISAEQPKPYTKLISVTGDAVAANCEVT